MLNNQKEEQFNQKCRKDEKKNIRRGISFDVLVVYH